MLLRLTGLGEGHPPIRRCFVTTDTAAKSDRVLGRLSTSTPVNELRYPGGYPRGIRASGEPDLTRLDDCFHVRKLVLPERIELSTSPLPRECSTTELRQPVRDAGGHMPQLGGRRNPVA